MSRSLSHKSAFRHERITPSSVHMSLSAFRPTPSLSHKMTHSCAIAEHAPTMPNSSARVDDGYPDPRMHLPSHVPSTSQHHPAPIGGILTLWRRRCSYPGIPSELPSVNTHSGHL